MTDPIKQAGDKVFNNETLKTEDIVTQFGGVVTINGMKFTLYNGEEVPLFSFVEGDGASFWGSGKKLREFAEELYDICDRDLSKVNRCFRRRGIKIKIGTRTKTRDGRDFRPVTKLGYVDFNESEKPSSELDAREFVGETLPDDYEVPF